MMKNSSQNIEPIEKKSMRDLSGDAIRNSELVRTSGPCACACAGLFLSIGDRAGACGGYLLHGIRPTFRSLDLDWLSTPEIWLSASTVQRLSNEPITIKTTESASLRRQNIVRVRSIVAARPRLA
ncbi:hypothetical protein EVAR_20913_1 [Eumeta japonica]|uniref:Uncharacterized protein n=1 Tax=Eumeta variegata TaxID=151549 RepID=A0A4C1UW50_EUMVA|nr:hypothetical protein EVAR_20913_1 [Eumeta japonica]